MSERQLSVVICTHNPREDYLQATLAALRAQTLPVNAWELIIVDNASTPPLEGRLDLSFQPNGRVVREEKLGLTAARLRGIAEVATDVIVFLDDDNVPEADFLEAVRAISQEWPRLGAWGGQILPKYETSPPAWSKPYIHALAMRQCDRDFWSNVPGDVQSTPCGAGMCVRRSVAEAYVRALKADSRREALDRCGGSLASGGDTDLALTSYDLGLGNGVFAAMKLTHLIPSCRVEEDYLLRLIESSAYSQVMLAYYRGTRALPRSRSQRFYDWYRNLRLDDRTRRFESVKLCARDAAVRDIEKIEREMTGSNHTSLTHGQPH